MNILKIRENRNSEWKEIPAIKGDKGEQGISIASVEQTVTSQESEGSNTITVTLSDGKTSDFYVKNGKDGQPGPQGPAGETGPKGDQGVPGEKGETGPRGLQGETGVQGATGPEGKQGPAGKEGSQGPRGEQGLPGTDGAKGEKGDPGKGFSIAKIYKSFEEMNSDFSAPESVVKENDFVIIASNVEDPHNAELYIKGKEKFDLIADLSGATGLTGPKGDAGKDGAIGPQGPIGETGAQGPAGKDGTNGKDGAQGPRGLQGVPGEKGDQGLPGKDGTNGQDGKPGAKGDAGKSAYQVAVDNGYKGSEKEWIASLKGAKGDRGETGPQGPQGIQGETGSAGKNGATGPSGANGKDGVGIVSIEQTTYAADGRDNIMTITLSKGEPIEFRVPSGMRGEIGPEGPAGLNGDNGLPGQRGPQGFPGAPGEDGRTPIKGIDYFTDKEIQDMILVIEKDLKEAVYNRIKTLEKKVATLEDQIGYPIA